MLETHGVLRLKRRNLMEMTKVLRHETERKRLVMSEAVLIKEKKPSLNSQEEGCDRLLKIFKH